MRIQDDYSIRENQQSFLEEINFHSRELLHTHVNKVLFVDNYSEPYRTHNIFNAGNFGKLYYEGRDIDRIELLRTRCLDYSSVVFGRLIMALIYQAHFVAMIGIDLDFNDVSDLL